MSETLSTIEFTTTPTPDEAFEAVANEGAIAIHNFLPENHLLRAARVLSGEHMRTDTDPNAKVQRRHDLIQYSYEHGKPWAPQVAGLATPPEPILGAARKIDQYIDGAEQARWRPNEIMGHKYNRGDFIARHRDYASALGYVAVLTLEGSQEFYFQRDNGDIANVTMEPGTLTVMRGFVPGSEKQRPYHWVEPAQGRRLAISLRQMRMDWD